MNIESESGFPSVDWYLDVAIEIIIDNIDSVCYKKVYNALGSDSSI